MMQMPARLASKQNAIILDGTHFSLLQRAASAWVELVALRRVAPRRAAQRPSGAAHSVRSTRTGLSQRDKHHLQETEKRNGAPSSSSARSRAWAEPSGSSALRFMAREHCPASRLLDCPHSAPRASTAIRAFAVLL